ncbi:MAG: hypothetical protein ACI8QD_001430 [Cyclobacteriaceae bacterium]|jgi:hypothetical protein
MTALGFEQIFTNEFGSGYINEEEGAIALVAEADYIPIKNFKQLFEMLADEIESNPVYSKFIFDKRALRTFHQPSMKWYFMEWKTKMIIYGLNKHYKILPDLGYFKKAVEAARKPLLKKYPQEILSKLSIEYCDDVESALKAGK